MESWLLGQRRALGCTLFAVFLATWRRRARGTYELNDDRADNSDAARYVRRGYD